MQGKSKGWVVVIFEGEFAEFDHEVAFVKGPFDSYEEAADWADTAEECQDGEFQITFIEEKDVTVKD